MFSISSIGSRAPIEDVPIPNSFLREFLRATGLANVAYLAFNMPTGLADRPLLSAVHAASWRKSYAQARRVDLEPVVRVGFGGIMPVDWRLLDRDDPMVGKLLGEALELDLGANGFSIPLRGRSGEYGLFSVCCPEDASSLLSPRHALIRRLMVMSAIFHASVRGALARRTPRRHAVVGSGAGLPAPQGARNSAIMRSGWRLALLQLPCASGSKRRAPGFTPTRSTTPSRRRAG